MRNFLSLTVYFSGPEERCAGVSDGVVLASVQLAYQRHQLRRHIGAVMRHFDL